MSHALSILAGVGMGAGLMYILDPQTGRRRRALARDKMANAAHKPTIVNPSFGCIAPLLLNLEKLDFKRQLGVGRDNSGIAALAVAEFGGNRKLAFASGLHSRDSLIPALDNFTCAELESERLISVLAAVELGAVLVA